MIKFAAFLKALNYYKKVEFFLKKLLTKCFKLSIIVQANFKLAPWSLKIEQHEIWKAQDCAFSLITHWETQKVRKEAREKNSSEKGIG